MGRWKFDLCGGHLAIDFANTVSARHTHQPIERLPSYADLVEYKALRGYGNLLLQRDALREVLSQNHLVMSVDDARHPDRLQEGASRLLRSYVDRFYSLKERQAEGAQLEPQPLVLKERATTSYRVRAPTEILAQIKRLVKRRRFDADGETFSAAICSIR